MTTMIVLLESNSLKLAPISFIAVIDGASSGAIGAECSSPTTSSCGAIDVHHDGDDDPEQDDRHREDAEHVREDGPLAGSLGGLGRA